MPLLRAPYASRPLGTRPIAAVPLLRATPRPPCSQAWDIKYPPADNKATSGVYHCVVGSNFACSVTHETHFSSFWQCDNVKLLLYKSKDSPFD